MSSISDIKDFLDNKVLEYNSVSFIASDPIQIPHRFESKEDIEISGFLTATIAWGQRTTIIRNANLLMDMMEGNPYEFIMETSENEFDQFLRYVHRTFNGMDCIFFLKSLKNIYLNYGGMEVIFSDSFSRTGDLYDALADFRAKFLSFPGAGRTSRHLPNVIKGSAAKRLNMYLRWMIRNDKSGVDFGLWREIPMSALYIPLDIHSGNTARKLGLLTRKQNDWRAVEELTGNLRKLDMLDPVKYDYALFGLGVFEKF